MRTILAGILTLFALSASGSAAADEGVSWKDTFQEEDVRNYTGQIADFMKNPRCQALAGFIAHRVQKYGNAMGVYRSAGDTTINLQEAANIRTELEADIFGFISKDHPECLEAAIQTYYLASYHLFVTSGEYRTESPAPAFLAVHLANKGKLKIDYKQPVLDGGKRRSLGGYNCRDTSIHLFVPTAEEIKDGSRLPSPLAAGGLLGHEVSHLLMDKTSSVEDLKRDFPGEKPGEIDWKRYVLSDETLAVGQTALREHSILKRAFDEAKVQAASAEKVFPLNQIGTDNRIFESRYPWSSFFTDQPVVGPGGVIKTGFVVAGAVLGSPLLPYMIYKWISEANEEADSEEAAKKMFAKIGEVYRLLNEDPTRPCASVDADLRVYKSPYYDVKWASGNHEVYLNWNQALERDYFPWAKDVPNTSHEIRDRYRGVSIDVGRFLEALKVLDKQLDTPSEVCQAYAQAIEDGKLGNYIGRELGSALKDKTGRPSGDGVKPGIDSLEPDNTFRPCVHLDEEGNEAEHIHP